MLRPACRGALFCLLSAVAAAQSTSDALRAVAAALVADTAPARDDPAARIEALLTAAEAARGHAPATALLVRVGALLPLAPVPETLLDRLAALRGAGSHGDVVQQVDQLRMDLLRRLGRLDRAAAASCTEGYATLVTVVGPFGDAGDYYTGVPFPPERAFPRAGTVLAGRFGPVRPRAVARDWNRFRIDLRDPRTEHVGCFYALHRVRAARAVPCYVRLWHSGSFTVFVNGERRMVVDRTDRDDVPVYVPVVLQAGDNHVLIKTTDNEVTSFGLRYVDRAGHVVPGLVEVAEGGMRPHADVAPRPSPPPPWQSHAEQLQAAATACEPGEGRKLLQLAATISTDGPVSGFRALDPVWQDPPDDPATRLALAELLTRNPLLPEAVRLAEARKIADEAADALPDHHAALLHRARNLQGEDRLEDAIRLLRAGIDRGGAGPGSFAALAGLYAQLEFDGAARRTWTRWMAAHPADLRPVLALIRTHLAAGDIDGAERLIRAGLVQHPGHRQLLAWLFGSRADRGDRDGARALIPRLHQEGIDPLARLETEASLARRLGDAALEVELQRRIAADPLASVARLRNAARVCLEAGEADAALDIDRSILAAAPESHAVRRRRARAAGTAEFADLARFRVDAAELLRGFTPTERERGSSSTLLLDQMLAEVYPDGSWVEEVHTLRRINDQRGVEEYQHASGAAEADEVVLVRTIGTDGRSYVPSRVQDRFSLPRLEPGALVEQVYRNTHPAPAPGPWRGPTFHFQSLDAPYLRSELVVILPPGHAGTFRERRFQGVHETTALAGGRTAHRFRVDDSPRLPAEVSPPPVADLAPIVSYGADGSIAPLARRFAVDARRRCLVTPPIERQAAVLTRGATTDAERLAAIHRFVHAEIADAHGRVDPLAVLMLRKGPRFFLEVALLRAAGVPLRHGLCAPSRRELREEGAPIYADDVAYSIPCVLVTPRGAPPLWLFADSPRHFPAGAIPSERNGAEVLLADPAAATTLPAADDWGADDGVAARGTLRLDASGAGTLEIRIELRGARGYRFAAGIRDEKQSDRDRIARGMIGQLLPGWSLTSAGFVDLDRPGPLTVAGTLHRGDVVRPAGERFLLPLPIRPSAWLRTFGGRGTRLLPLRLERQNAMDWEIRVEPGPFVVTDVPPPAAAVEMLVDYALRWQRDGAALSLSRRTRQRAGEVPARAFGAWRDLLRRLDEAEAANVTLKRGG